MRSTIQYIEQELSGLYPKPEIKAFTRLMLEQVCGLNYTQQVLMRDQVLDASFSPRIRSMVERLKKYEPVQYILGETEFMGLRIKVTPAVLIPRPETEELVQWVVETGFPKAPSLLDAGTGSGCIALGMKKQMPDASVFAFDNSEQALGVARENAALNNLEVNFFQGDMLHWEKTSWDYFSAIVSNPPYVRYSEREKMEDNVVNYEPEKALFVSDAHPLRYYQKMTELAARYLIQKGWLFFEINENLGSEMKSLVQHYGFDGAEIKKDVFGRDRMLRCRKPLS